ncbi:hypothetical protein HK096_005114, partial [Nowakowskiella sp. JEL0078]
LGDANDDLVFGFSNVALDSFLLAWMCYMSYTAIQLHLQKRKWMSALNVYRILAMFEDMGYADKISNYQKPNCPFIKGIISSQLLLPLAWSIMYVRIMNLYKSKPHVLWIIGFVLLVAFGCTFPQTIYFGAGTDKYLRCNLIVDNPSKILFFAVDVFVVSLLCGIFVRVVWKYLNGLGSSTANRLQYLIRCSLRAAFIDCGFTMTGFRKLAFCYGFVINEHEFTEKNSPTDQQHRRKPKNSITSRRTTENLSFVQRSFPQPSYYDPFHGYDEHYYNSDDHVFSVSSSYSGGGRRQKLMLDDGPNVIEFQNLATTQLDSMHSPSQ